MKKVRIAELAEVLIDKMFEIAEHKVSYRDIIHRKDSWFTEWTMTPKQQEEWMKWGAEYIHTKLRIPKYLAEREMDLFNFNYGLSLSTRISEKSKKVT